jgi:hypothetical protein
MGISFSRRRFASLAPGLFASPAWLTKASATQQPSAEALGVYFNVRDFGASGNGSRVETSLLQAAIDACANAGGGVVYFPAGTYLSGTLHFRNGVTLHLAEGSKLLGSPNLGDYPVITPEYRSYTDNYSDKSLLYGEKVERIGITGRGVIDGQGAAFPRSDYKTRPYLLRLVQCRDVSVSDLTFQNSPMWVQHYLACEDVTIRGVKVRDRDPCCTSNHDGIDIDSCQRVRVSDCDIAAEDDGLCLKSTSALPCRDVVITNCVITSRHNAIKFGTESVGGFENITISNISIHDTRMAGLALEIVDGGLMDRVTISNIVMRETGCPIFIRLGDRGRPAQEGQPRPGVGRLRNVVISNVQATGADGIGCSVTGIPARAVENVTLENVSVSFRGGGTREAAQRVIPEQENQYPEYWMFGVLSAYGLYCRHVRGLTLRNFHLTYDQPEMRPALVCDDVTNLNLTGIGAASQPDGEPLIRFTDVSGAWLQGCQALAPANTFLEVSGSRSSSVRLLSNDFSNVARSVELSSGLPGDRVQSCGCRTLPPARRVR